MNRLKSQYMQTSLFSTDQQPYYLNEFTPFQGISFLPDDYKKEQVKIQSRPFSNEVTNVLQPSSRYAQQNDTNRLRGSIAKSSKLQALISTQAGSSLAISRSTSLKLSVLSMRAGGVGLERERARYDQEKKENETVTAPPVKLVGLAAEKKKEKEKEGAIKEDDIFDILQPTAASRNRGKMAEKKEETKEVGKAPGGKVRLSALAKTMKLKNALDEQAELQSKSSLMQNPERLKAKLADFYASVNVTKSEDFLDSATKHIQDHGFGAFQEKLVNKYGRGLDFETKAEEDEGKQDEEFANKSLSSPFKSLGVIDVDPSLMRERIKKFYNSIGESKDPSFIDSVMQQIEHRGVEKFNEGLKDKYGVDLDSDKKELAIVRMAMPQKAPPRGNIFSNILSGRFRPPSTTGAGLAAGAVRESIESTDEEKKAPRRAIFSMMGRGDREKNSDAKKPGKIAAVLGNLMNFRPGRRSVAFNGRTT